MVCDVGTQGDIFVCHLSVSIGQRGVYTASSGAVIAYLSGKYDYKTYKDSASGGQMVCTWRCV